MHRRSAASALSVLCLTVLALALAGCADTERRETVHEALARWEDRRSADPDSLARLLEDDDAHVRRAALRAAGRIGRSDVLTELLAGLDDLSPAVRATAVRALGFLGDPAAAEPLAAAFPAGSPEVRRAVLFALARVPNDGELLLETALRGETAEAVLAWNALRDRSADFETERLAEAIRSGLVRDETDVLWRVLRCAERVDDDGLVELIATFAVHRNAQVRVHACRALAARGGAAAYDGLLDCGHEPGGVPRPPPPCWTAATNPGASAPATATASTWRCCAAWAVWAVPPSTPRTPIPSPWSPCSPPDHAARIRTWPARPWKPWPIWWPRSRCPKPPPAAKA